MAEICQVLSDYCENDWHARSTQETLCQNFEVGPKHRSQCMTQDILLCTVSALGMNLLLMDRVNRHCSSSCVIHLIYLCPVSWYCELVLHYNKVIHRVFSQVGVVHHSTAAPDVKGDVQCFWVTSCMTPVTLCEGQLQYWWTFICWYCRQPIAYRLGVSQPQRTKNHMLLSSWRCLLLQVLL